MKIQKYQADWILIKKIFINYDVKHNKNTIILISKLKINWFIELIFFEWKPVFNYFLLKNVFKKGNGLTYYA